MSACPHCQAPLIDGSRFCGACGKAAASTETQQDPNRAAGPSVPVDMIGREIAGRYRIIAKLGEGGMGAVFRAEQISLKRAVAIKLLRSEMSNNPNLLRRFNAEAELVGKLSHPNTVNVYDRGADTDGTLFIAMELVEGPSLRAVLRDSGPLPPPRALAIAAQIAASLTDAHAHGIVHRDLKPDNVMLQERGKERDVVRVLDFGIAKLRDDSRAATQQMTQAGDMLGTPQYMAPEQIRSEPIDGRTDIYALGCLLYEMLTARMVFEAPTVMAMLSKHLMEPVVPPSQRRPDLGITPALDELVMCAVAKPIDARPASMELYGEHITSLLRAYQPVDSGVRRSGLTAPPVASPRPAMIAPMGYAGFDGPMPTPPNPFAPVPAPPVLPPSSIPMGYGGIGASGAAVGGLAAARAAAGPTEMVDPLPRPALVRGPNGVMVLTSMPAPANKSHTLVIVLVTLAAVAITGVGIGVVLSRRRAVLADANDPWAEHGKTPDPSPPPTPAGALPTAMTSLPAGASIDPPYDAIRINDLANGVHYADPSHGADYFMAPLFPGTNDPTQLAQMWVADHPGMSLVNTDHLVSAGATRDALMFSGTIATPSGPVVVTQIAALYITKSYRVGVIAQMPVAAFNDPTFAKQLEAFFTSGVKMP